MSLGDILKGSAALKIAAIPTTFAGVTFRSRLEAKWAATFTQLGWHWSYEPMDLPGWFPDFLLEGRLLVEVKPFTLDQHWLTVRDERTNRTVTEDICGAYRSLGVVRETLLLGECIRPVQPGYSNPPIGWLWSPQDQHGDDYGLDNAMLYELRGNFDISAENGAWVSRLDRAHVDKWYHYSPEPEAMASLISAAKNAVQWRAAT